MYQREPLLFKAIALAATCFVAAVVTSHFWLLPGLMCVLFGLLYRAHAVPAAVRRAAKHTLIPVEGVIDPVTGAKPGPIVAYLCTDSGCDYWCEPHEMPPPEKPIVVDRQLLPTPQPKAPKSAYKKTYRHPRTGKAIRPTPTKQRGLMVWAGDLNAVADDRDQWREAVRQNEAHSEELKVQISALEQHHLNYVVWYFDYLRTVDDLFSGLEVRQHDDWLLFLLGNSRLRLNKNDLVKKPLPMIGEVVERWVTRERARQDGWSVRDSISWQPDTASDHGGRSCAYCGDDGGPCEGCQCRC